MKFSITTTLPYVNADPHIGFALEIIQADVLARWRRLLGDDVTFNTGTDEHGQKIFKAAEAAGLDPKTYCDGFATKFNNLKASLNLSYDRFIRTTDAHHVTAAREFWKRCAANGDIYKTRYRVKYCVGCELEKTDSELVDGACPLHPKLAIELRDEENYFFRWSNYKQRLLNLYAAQPDFVVPESRMKEIRTFVEAGLNDFSISRLAAKMPWGIPVPDDESHVMYVWFDALVNYISTLGWPEESGDFDAFWPSVQVAGKDNLRQQAAMWQAMLMSAGVAPSKQIFIHGFVTADGQKMSKSLGNVINPFDIVEAYGADALRYYLLARLPSYDDGDFSRVRMEERYASDLANTLGNLIQRVIAMSRKSFNGCVPFADPAAAGALAEGAWSGAEGLVKIERAYDEALSRFRFDEALGIVWGAGEEQGSGLMQANKFIEETKPFRLVKEDEKKTGEILYALLEAIRHYAWLLDPVMPEAARKMLAALGQDRNEEAKKGIATLRAWGGLAPGSTLPEPEPIFPRLDN